MTKGKKLLIGCVSIPLAGLLVLVCLVVVVAVLPAPEVAIESTELRHEIGPARPDLSHSRNEASQDAPASSAEIVGPPRRVRVELEEGEFEIVPGPPGGSIRVEGRYNTGAYELVIDEPAPGEHVVRFGRRVSMLRLLKGGPQTQENRLRVELPRGIPINLELVMRKGECRADLSGLALASLDVSFSMGEAAIKLDSPNPIEMDHFIVAASMGELRIRGLSDARARDVSIAGSMGEIKLRFGGPLLVDATASVGVRMGSAEVSLPDDYELRHVSRSAFFGNVESPDVLDRRPGSPETTSRSLDLSLRASFGEVTAR